VYYYISYLPLSQAAFNISNPSCSSITQFIHSLLPIPMVPRIGEETRSPEEPSWTYTTLVAFTLLCSEAGTGGAGIFLVMKVFKSKVSAHNVSMLSTVSACNEASYIDRGINLRSGSAQSTDLGDELVLRMSISHRWTQGNRRR